MMHYLQNGVAIPLRGSCAHRQAYNGTRTGRVQTTYNVQFKTIARSAHHVGMSSARGIACESKHEDTYITPVAHTKALRKVQTWYTLFNGTITVRVRTTNGKIVRPMHTDGYVQ